VTCGSRRHFGGRYLITVVNADNNMATQFEETSAGACRAPWFGIESDLPDSTKAWNARFESSGSLRAL